MKLVPRPAVRALIDPPRSAIPELVDRIIEQALARRASDIHVEPTGDGLIVRFRVDGLLHVATTVAQVDAPAVVARIKIMASLDIAEHRLPQDGRIRIPRGAGSLDVRVSTVPSLHGEKAVLRLLDLEGVAIPLDRIGIDAEDLATLDRLIRKPQGSVFVTGPTGSGKTSTIYACLTRLRSETTNIVTIEDPVEYEMAGVTQIPVHDKIGLSFAACLRAVLRQDPDVILVGEVRDLETARIAMQASLTGHLVFATLHTNDAASAVTRLIDMGIPPYLVASSLSLIVAQRLARALCAACKEPWEPDAAARAALGLGDRAAVLQRPRGCASCHGTGVRGRTGVFEVMPMTAELRTAVSDGASEAELRRLVRSSGSRSMHRHAAQKVIAGEVAWEEFLRIVDSEGAGDPVDGV